jgi:hypothetical protein
LQVAGPVAPALRRASVLTQQLSDALRCLRVPGPIKNIDCSPHSLLSANEDGHVDALIPGCIRPILASPYGEVREALAHHAGFAAAASALLACPAAYASTAIAQALSGFLASSDICDASRPGDPRRAVLRLELAPLASGIVGVLQRATRGVNARSPQGSSKRAAAVQAASAALGLVHGILMGGREAAAASMGDAEPQLPLLLWRVAQLMVDVNQSLVRDKPDNEMHPHLLA